ncbi:MAG: hypothetical protein ABIO94_09705 [Opitutaceae bacterium]
MANPQGPRELPLAQPKLLSLCVNMFAEGAGHLWKRRPRKVGNLAPSRATNLNP